MFCPKCGENLPDGAAFCGKCGNQMGDRAAAPAAAPATTPAAAPAAAAGSAAHAAAPKAGNGAGLSPLRIATAVVAALMLVLSLFPWFETDSTVQSASSTASGITGFVSDLAGSSYSLPEFEESYAPWQFIDLGATATQYGAVDASIKKAQKEMQDAWEEATSTGRQRAKAIGLSEPQYVSASESSFLILGVDFVIWLVAVVVSVIGIILTLMRKAVVPLVVGCVLMALVCILFMTVGMGSIGDYGESTMTVLLCCIAAVGGVVVGIACRKSQKKAV